jgi:hypothetical protein
MYLIPPMDDEPPAEFVAFVAAHLTELRRETDRLVGGDAEAGHLYMEVLSDVAGHWRRLVWRGRLLGVDAASAYLRQRLVRRTQQWRDDQVYEVDVRVLRPRPLFGVTLPSGSLALRKAALLPGTVREGLVAIADAGIAWVHAYRRQQWHRVGRSIVFGVLLIGGMIQFMSAISVDY